ncbi:hypothetical protein CNR22_05600 [Sphingobacteriaceae bacterium]|nr:hypothetical protein CNR22_05600 [Sphingobacteriaceae bacterium]
MTKYIVLALLLLGCAPKNDNAHSEKKNQKDSLVTDSLTKIAEKPEIKINDSLNAVAELIAGIYPPGKMFSGTTENQHYKNFSDDFSKRWNNFDSTRMQKLLEFRNKELMVEIKPEPNLFYPFSGPDILYANLFFPQADKTVMIGLEPVGTLPEFNALKGDSLKRYYDKLNSSLHAILNFSFFRTEAMSKDLKNGEVDGTIHLLFLFLSRTGNAIVSAKPVTVDSLGNKIYLASFETLKTSNLKSKGVEILYKTAENKLKELNYYSLNVVDVALDSNPGFKTYLRSFKNFNTYLKGASYLLHKTYFSFVREIILKGSSTIVQDDSGIALRYFKQDDANWSYKLFGEYTKPISLFKNAYQKDLDSLYKHGNSTALGFGIGYNFKDKNSNLMVARRN